MDEHPTPGASGACSYSEQYLVIYDVHLLFTKDHILHAALYVILTRK